MSLGVPLHDALREKQAPHSLCRACSLEVPATLIEPECEIDRVLLRISAKRAVLSKRRYPEQLEATTGH